MRFPERGVAEGGTPGPLEATFQTPGNGELLPVPMATPIGAQETLGSTSLHAIAVLFTPLFVYAFFWDSTDKPTLRFGFSQAQINLGLMAAGVVLGMTSFYYAISRGASVASSHCAIYGALLGVAVRFIVGKTSSIASTLSAENDDNDGMMFNDVLKVAAYQALMSKSRKEAEALQKKQKTGHQSQEPTLTTTTVTTSADKTEEGSDLCSWLLRHDLTPLEEYMATLSKLGADSVTDLGYLQAEDLKGNLPPVKMRKLLAAMAASRAAKKTD